MQRDTRGRRNERPLAEVAGNIILKTESRDKHLLIFNIRGTNVNRATGEHFSEMLSVAVTWAKQLLLKCMNTSIIWKIANVGKCPFLLYAKWYGAGKVRPNLVFKFQHNKEYSMTAWLSLDFNIYRSFKQRVKLLISNQF